jgi:hypothetical protein
MRATPHIIGRLQHKSFQGYRAKAHRDIQMANTKLTSLEIQSLKSVCAGSVIEMHMKARLSELGLIEQKLGGWVLTHSGIRYLDQR